MNGDKMKFYEVQPALEEGSRIRRQSWGNLYICIFEGVICEGRMVLDLYVIAFKMYEFSQDDILADDWVILGDIS